MHYLIVGNSYAALFAIEAIRHLDQEGEIGVISEESEPLYSRAMLHEYLGAQVEDRLLYLRGRDFYVRQRVKPLLGHRVTGLDVSAKQIYLGEDPLPFVKLLLAVGGTPIIPPGIEGLDGFDQVFTFTRFADAVSLRAAATQAETAVVLGGGLIGLQCAEGLSHLGKQVHVVELADTILPMALDGAAAGMIEAELRAEGMIIHTAETITALYGRGRELKGVTLRGGQDVPCQLLVVAIGVRPHVDFLRPSGLRLDRGVVVNHHLETSAADIYAAGDCAQAPELISQQGMVIPIIPVASTQGMMAGYNMAGGQRPYRGALAMNALQFGGLPMISYGFVKDEEGAEVCRRWDAARGLYKKVIIKEGRITGAVFVRAIDRAGLFRYLIEEGVDVTPFQDRLLDDDFNATCLPQAERQRMFAPAGRPH